MAIKISKQIVWLLLAAVSWIIALLAATGNILADDTTGRLIYTIAWAAIGLGWIGRYMIEKRKIAKLE
ncbi:MAG: hypothetical protein E4H13_05970 [Calditrichales bacterium]|nr:MAG: hypothetical protein E4H13_05970 [Calditrichales bacterium]